MGEVVKSRECKLESPYVHVGTNWIQSLLNHSTGSGCQYPEGLWFAVPDCYAIGTFANLRITSFCQSIQFTLQEVFGILDYCI